MNQPRLSTRFSRSTILPTISSAGHTAVQNLNVDSFTKHTLYKSPSLPSFTMTPILHNEIGKIEVDQTTPRSVKAIDMTSSDDELLSSAQTFLTPTRHGKYSIFSGFRVSKNGNPSKLEFHYNPQETSTNSTLHSPSICPQPFSTQVVLPIHCSTAKPRSQAKRSSTVSPPKSRRGLLDLNDQTGDLEARISLDEFFQPPCFSGPQKSTKVQDKDREGVYKHSESLFPWNFDPLQQESLTTQARSESNDAASRSTDPFKHPLFFSSLSNKPTKSQEPVTPAYLSREGTNDDKYNAQKFDQNVFLPTQTDNNLFPHSPKTDSDCEDLPDAAPLSSYFEDHPRHPQSINRDWAKHFHEQQLATKSAAQAPQTRKRGAEMELQPKRKAKKPLVLPKMSSGKQWRSRAVDEEVDDGDVMVGGEDDLKSTWAGWGTRDEDDVYGGGEHRDIEGYEGIGGMTRGDDAFERSLSAILNKALGGDDDEVSS